jgi:two-component system response regulator AtoC
MTEQTAGDNAPIKPLAEVEKDHISMVYEQTGANKSRTARLLGIGLNTLRRKLVGYGIS